MCNQCVQNLVRMFVENCQDFTPKTGCDSVSVLSDKEKSKAFGFLTRLMEFSECIFHLGETLKEVSEEL